MKRLVIIGSGDLGQLIAYHAKTDNKFIVIGFLDDYKTKGETVNSIPVLGKVAEAEDLYLSNQFDCLMIAVGYRHMKFRKELFEQLSSKIPFGTLIHSNAYISESCKIGNGVFILPGCVLDNNVSIGDNVLLNTSVTIAHDSTVSAHTFLSPRVAVAGFTTIGSCCIIGINTTIIDNITISNNVQTGGGTVVIKNLEESGLYVGVPAKKVK